MDAISELVAEALRQARLVQKSLDARTIPLLEPRDRAFAFNISRRITRRAIVNEGFLADLEALLVMIDARADEETSFAWRGHEHDPTCGYTVPVRSDRAIAFHAVCAEMVDLASAVAAALDAAQAFAIANGLFDT
jgi:hypothetical protein